MARAKADRNLLLEPPYLSPSPAPHLVAVGITNPVGGGRGIPRASSTQVGKWPLFCSEGATQFHSLTLGHRARFSAPKANLSLFALG